MRKNLLLSVFGATALVAGINVSATAQRVALPFYESNYGVSAGVEDIVRDGKFGTVRSRVRNITANGLELTNGTLVRLPRGGVNQVLSVVAAGSSVRVDGFRYRDGFNRRVIDAQSITNRRTSATLNLASVGTRPAPGRYRIEGEQRLPPHLAEGFAAQERRPEPPRRGRRGKPGARRGERPASPPRGERPAPPPRGERPAPPPRPEDEPRRPAR